MQTQNNRKVEIGEIQISNDLPLVVFAGINVIESRDLVFKVAETLQQICKELNMPLIFKASFDKANRSSINSFRGLGLETGLEILFEVKQKFNLPIITDVHEIYQANEVAKVADVLQLPAFLARQTDLVKALAFTGKPINIKKPQFLSPSQMYNILHKFEEAGNSSLMLCERGSCFGYDNLVVDLLGFDVMKAFKYPLIFDVTHSLQMRATGAEASGGRGEQVFSLMRSGVAQKIAGLFVETHPNPKEAKCDGASALDLKKAKEFLYQAKQIDQLVKKFN